MRESDTDRWQLVTAAVLMVVIAAGIYVARHEGPLIVAPSSRKGAVGTTHKPKRTNLASATAATAASATAATAASATTSAGPLDSSDSSIEGLEDCRSRLDEGTVVPESTSLPTAELNRAVALVDSNRNAAVDAMRALPEHAVPNAYLAYLLLDAGKTEEARALLTKARRGLTEPACVLTLRELGSPKRSQLAFALRTLRFALEPFCAANRPVPLACSVFATQPKEAVWAFGVVWGSEADEAGAKMKQHCVEQLVRKAHPGLERRVTMSLFKLRDWLLEIRVTPERTKYYGVLVSVNNILRDAILAPELVTLVDERVSLDGLTQMSKDDPALGKRIDAYHKVVEDEAPVLGTGICAVLEARSKPSNPEKCEHLARKTALEALHFWLLGTKTGSD